MTNVKNQQRREPDGSSQEEDELRVVGLDFGLCVKCV